MTNLEILTVFLFVTGLITSIVGFTGDYETPAILGITILVFSWLPAALETHPATPVEANTPVGLLEVEHQRVVDSIEREYTIELKELELKQLKQLK